MQVGACLIAARLIGIRGVIPLSLAASIGSIHPSFMELFGFDSVRVAYPLGNLVGVLGLAIATLGRWYVIPAAILVSLAPSFYPSAISFVGIVVCFIAAARLRSGKTVKHVASVVLQYCIVVGLGVFIYLVVTKVIIYLTGSYVDSRFKMDFYTIPERIPFFFKQIKFGLLGSFPYETKKSYFLLVFSSLIFVPTRKVKTTLINILILALAAMAPAIFSLVVPCGYIPYRALYPYAFYYGGIIGIATSISSFGSDFIDNLVRIAGGCFGVVLLGGFILSCNVYAFHERIAYQADILMTNRMLYRIESLDSFPSLPPNNRTIAVVGHTRGWTSNAGIGSVKTNRDAPWSKTRIFRVLDNSLNPAVGQQLAEAKKLARGHSAWPAKDSVFIENNMIIVVLEGGLD